MSLLSAQQQELAFEAIRQEPQFCDPHEGLQIHVPELLIVESVSSVDVASWLVRQHERFARERTADYEAEAAGVRGNDRPAVLQSIIAYDEAGYEQDFWFDYENPSNQAVSLQWLEQNVGRLMLLPSYAGLAGNNVLATINTTPGFDVRVAEGEYLRIIDGKIRSTFEPNPKVKQLDLNSAALDQSQPEDWSELVGLALDGATPTKLEREFVLQASALYGDRSHGLGKLKSKLPHIAVAQVVVAEALQTNDFALAFRISGSQLEMRPLQQFEMKQQAKVDIDHIVGSLEYRQADYSGHFIRAGSGIVNGKPQVVDHTLTEPVLEGSIVMIDDEVLMEGIAPALLEPAAAILTRGQTGELGRMPGRNEHLSIIGHDLAEDRPGSFIYFRVPHMNPESEARQKWNQLKEADVITVASDGVDIKLAHGTHL